MSELLTEQELWRIYNTLSFSGETILAAKVLAIVRAEISARNTRATRIPLTSRQIVKEMILDSPLAHVPDVVQPLDVVNVAIRLSYLRRLLEAVEAL